MILSEEGSKGTPFDTSWRLSAGTTTGGAARALLRFPLNDLVQPGTRIDSAQLQLWYDQSHTSTGHAVTLEARRMTQPWDATTATWDNASANIDTNASGLGTYSVQADEGDLLTGQTGSWPASTNASQTQHAANGDFVSNSGAATGDTYTWYPCLSESGNYRVEAHHVTASDRATAAPYTVNHKGGASPFTVNQSASTVGGRWARLGSSTQTFAHDAGCFTGSVVLGDVANKVVVADAVRWTKDGTAVRPLNDETSRWHSFSVQNLVQGWVNGPSSNHGFVLKAADEERRGPGRAALRGSESTRYGGETANRPRLVVTYGRPGVTLNAADDDPRHRRGAVLDGVRRPVQLPHRPERRHRRVPGAPQRPADVHARRRPRWWRRCRPASPATPTRPRTPTAAPTRRDRFGTPTTTWSRSKTGDGQLTPGPTQMVRLPKAGRVTQIYPGRLRHHAVGTESTTGHDTVFAAALALRREQLHDTTGSPVRWCEVPGPGRHPGVGTGGGRQSGSGTGRSIGNGAATWNLHALTQDFDETEATWNRANTTTPGPTPGGDFGAKVDFISGISNDPKRADLRRLTTQRRPH